MGRALEALVGLPERVMAELATRPRAQRIALALALVAPVLFFLRHLLPHPSFVGAFGDIRSFHFWWAVSRKEILEFGQLPFWNPYYCGGMVHWANVQTMFLAPTSPVGLIFGPGVGLRVHLIAHFVAGFVGCWVLARHRGLRGLWSFAPGVVFVFGANLAERATGHVGFMPFLLLPWLAYALARARTDLRFVIVAALLVAYCVFAGAPYPFVFFCIYIVITLAADLAAAVRDGWGNQRSPWSLARPAAVGAAIAALAVLVAAVKLLPVVDFMSEYPRHHGETDYLAPWQVWEVFLESPLVRHRKGYFYVFGEYRNYLGPVAMAALPLMLLRFRERARDFWMIAAAGALMLGDFAPWAPYTLLSKLPVVGSLRVPVRYALLVDLHIGLVFGHALQAGADRLQRLPAERHGLRRLGVAVLVALFFGCALDLVTNNNQQHRDFFREPDVVAPREGPFRMIRGRPHDVHQAPVRNEGHIQCYEANPLRISAALKANAPSEVYVPEGDGSVELVEWTPNRLRLRTDLPASGVVVVNMNHHRDWSAEGGTVRPWKGLLAVNVPAGQREVTLTYRPRRIVLYAGMTLIGLLSCGIGWWRLSARARRVGNGEQVPGPPLGVS